MATVKSPKPEPPLRGERWVLRDGSDVVIVEKAGDAWKVINTRGKIAIVYPGELARRASGY